MIMPIERYQDDSLGLNPYKEVTAATTLAVHEQIVRVTAGAAMNLTLPSVSEAKGRVYSIISKNGVTYTTTVIDQGDSEKAVSVALDANDEGVVLYSDGKSWFVLSNA